jgi:hypothetical protein
VGVVGAPGVEDGLAPITGEGEGVPIGIGPGAGEGHWYPKSGHVAPEKYTPSTVPSINKQQITTMAITTLVRIILYKCFFKLLLNFTIHGHTATRIPCGC